MNVSYGEDITVEHMCHHVGKEPTTKIGTVGKIFQQRPLRTLRNAHHKNLYNDVRRKILEYKECKELFLTTDIVNLALVVWRKNGSAHLRTRADTTIPISP